MSLLFFLAGNLTFPPPCSFGIHILRIELGFGLYNANTGYTSITNIIALEEDTMPKLGHKKIARGVKDCKKARRVNGMGTVKSSKTGKKGMEPACENGRRSESVYRNGSKGVCYMDDFDDICSEGIDYSSSNTDTDTEESFSESESESSVMSNDKKLQKKAIVQKNGKKKKNIAQCPGDNFSVNFPDSSSFSGDDDSIFDDSQDEYEDSKHEPEDHHRDSSRGESRAFQLPKKFNLKKKKKENKSVKLSRRMSYKLARPHSQSSPPPSPITATRLSFSPNRKSSATRILNGKRPRASRMRTKVTKTRRS